jgi:hypothetical protein
LPASTYPVRIVTWNDGRELARMAISLPVLCISLLAGLAFFAIGAFLVYSDYAASGWPPVDGTVTHSEIDVTHDARHNRENYQLDVEYEYASGGKAYTGSCCALTSNTRSDAEQRIAAFPEGGTVTVLANPQNPSESRLKNDIQEFNVGGIVFGVIGAILSLSILLAMARTILTMMNK